MKDKLDQYIKDQREQLDTELPDPNWWETVRDELHPKKKRVIPFFWKAAAAVLLLVAGSWITFFFTASNFENQDFFAYVEETLIEVPALAVILEEKEEEPFYKYVDDEEDLDNKKVEVFRNQVGEYDIEEKHQNLTVNSSYGLSTGIISSNVVSTNPEIDSKLAEMLNNAFGNTNGTDQSGTKGAPHGTSYGTAVPFLKIEPEKRREISSNQSLAGTFGYDKLDQDDEVFTYSWIDGSGFSTDSISVGSWNVNVVSNGGFQKTDYSSTSADFYYKADCDLEENEFYVVNQDPLSTFSIDVDKAAYAQVRKHLQDDFLPPKNVFRLEEMINYFDFDYPEPSDNTPFSVSCESGPCPWKPGHKLVKIGLKGRHVPIEEIPPSNLVFLIDVSGSMSSPDKLGLLKKGFRLLVNKLREEDKVSIVVYAGAAGMVLPPTSGNQKETILKALESLQSGGSTAGAEGLELAYQLAEENFKNKGNNRIVMATDGDFNVGLSGDDELVKMIEKKREIGIFLSILGFGSGNYQDTKMEKIADHGNGNYAYIDDILEAKKVLNDEMAGTLLTLAKDVKLQVEFNPAQVSRYRLIGYENRQLENKDFEDDTKDAGELGADHSVTALYEVELTKGGTKAANKLKYQVSKLSAAGNGKEWLTVKVRYKKPDEAQSQLVTEVPYAPISNQVSNDFRFVTAVAEYGLFMRDSEFKGVAGLDNVLFNAGRSLGNDPKGQRSGFIELVERTKVLFETVKKRTE